jgi:threonine dehydrogenase-like Zn-dependent dehydrogenase
VDGNNYVETPELPSRLGYEISGIVEAVGADVTNSQVGDRVTSIPAFSIGDYANFGEELESLPDALRFMASNQAAGKIVVTIEN